MNKLLNKLANNEKLSMGIIFGGAILSSMSLFVTLAGVFYFGLYKGAALTDEYYYQQELEKYRAETKENADGE